MKSRTDVSLEAALRDLRCALRGWRRNPGFAVAVVCTIALGIGACTAVFTVVDRILFRGLPYDQPDRLVSFGMAAPIVPQEIMLAYDYLDWRDAQAPFVSMASWAGVSDCDLTDAHPERLRCAYVESSLLPTLGLRPVVGRNFTREEDRPKVPGVVLLSYGLWRSRFSGDREIVGKSVPLDGQPVTVVGVLPREFELPSLDKVDVIRPQALDEAEQRTRRTATLLTAIGRLRPGVSPGQAAAALQPLFEKSLESVAPEIRKGVKFRLRPLADRQTREARLASWILLAAVLAVLLIACANVTNLLLARAAIRQRELAVRAAVGAGRGHLVRQALLESVLLGVAGGAAGCALAYVLLRLFVTVAPEGILRLNQASLDLRVLMFTLTLSVLTGAACGLAPALASPKTESLTGARTTGRHSRWFRQGLVAAQISLSLVLLTSASLLLRTLWNLQRQALGLRPEGVLTAEITLGVKSYPDAARRLRFFEELESRLRRVPGVTDLAVADSLPPSASLMGSMIYALIDIEGRPRIEDPTAGKAVSRSVTPRYFATLGIPILEGRAFEEEDRDPNQDVVIVSNTLARRMFPGENPLGKRIRPGRVGPWRTIVGVAGNVKNSGLVDQDAPEYYTARKHSMQSAGRSVVVILRSAADPGALAGLVREEIAALDPSLPATIESMRQHVRQLADRPRFNAVLLAAFAVFGLLLASIGLYGVISFVTTQRRREIGVRMALGATPGAIRRQVLGHAALWTAAGAAVGVIGSLFAVRLIQAMLFRVSAKDPWSLAAGVATLFGVAMAAAWLPSRRAARVDPVEALREE